MKLVSLALRWGRDKKKNKVLFLILERLDDLYRYILTMYNSYRNNENIAIDDHSRKAVSHQ